MSDVKHFDIIQVAGLPCYKVMVTTSRGEEFLNGHSAGLLFGTPLSWPKDGIFHSVEQARVCLRMGVEKTKEADKLVESWTIAELAKGHGGVPMPPKRRH